MEKPGTAAGRGARGPRASHLRRSAADERSPGHRAAPGQHWNFVEIIWISLFPLLYLIAWGEPCPSRRTAPTATPSTTSSRSGSTTASSGR